MLETQAEQFRGFYRNNYKKLMIIPVLFFLFAVAVLGSHKLKYGEFVEKDIDLKGGTIGSLSWNYTDRPDVGRLESSVMEKTKADVSVREIYSYGLYSQLLALNFEAGPEVEPASLKEAALAAVREQGFSAGEYNEKIVGPSMGEAFLKMSINALVVGLLLFGFVIFITFRTPVIVLTIVACAVLNTLGATAVMVLFGIKLSPATVAGLLMILGYTDDTNILITTSILRKTEGDPMSRAYAAMKTGSTMIATAFVSILVLWLVSNSAILRDIALVLMAGLVFDVANTWFTNLGVLLWYKERKEGGKNAAGKAAA